MKLRVFVSSVMRDFLDCREAARRCIVEAGAEAVLVEDFQPQSSSPRNSCLDGVGSSDAIVVIIGERGGQRALSGKLIVEEEYEEAKGLHRGIQIFIQNTDRDSDAKALVDRLCSYEGGHFVKFFDDCEELQKLVRSAVEERVSMHRVPQLDPAELSSRLNQVSDQDSSPWLRLVVAPQRSEEVIDRIEIGEERFRITVLEAGHKSGIDFFSYEAQKDHDLRGDDLVLVQKSPARSRDDSRRAVFSPSGITTLESNLEPADDSSRSYGYSGFVILRKDLDQALIQSFKFAAAVYDHVDPRMRHDILSYGVALDSIGQRQLSDEVPTGSFTMGFGNERDVIVVEDSRKINRESLRTPSAEVQRIVKLTERRMKRD